MFFHSCPCRWIRWLPLAKYWYNTNEHSAPGKSPFQVLYGRSPRQFEISNDCFFHGRCGWHVGGAGNHASRFPLAPTLCAVEEKAQADERHSERTFEVGDSVSATIRSELASAKITSQALLQVLWAI